MSVCWRWRFVWQFEEADFKINEIIWKYTLVIKVVAAAKAPESPHLAWIPLCFAQEKHRRERFDVPTKEAAELTAAKDGTQKALGNGIHFWGEQGYVYTPSGSTIVPQVGEAGSRLFSSSGIVQFLCPKEEVINPSSWSFPSCSYWDSNKCEGWAPFLLKRWLLPIDRQAVKSLACQGYGISKLKKHVQCPLLWTALPFLLPLALHRQKAGPEGATTNLVTRVRETAAWVFVSNLEGKFVLPTCLEAHTMFYCLYNLTCSSARLHFQCGIHIPGNGMRMMTRMTVLEKLPFP